ncbi:PorV/PorQ family protein [bacterium]|nr:PorV/PorQ family protein [bacterium]
MKRIIFVLFFFLIFSNTSFSDGPGTTNANFLKAGQGVRPIAMGETYIALGDGLDTLYWNPAGLAQIKSPAASFIHSFWVQDIGTEYLAYGMPLGPLGTIAGGITYMHAGTIAKTIEDENGNYGGIDGDASAMSVAFVGAYSQKLSRLMPIKEPFLGNILIGASVKIVSESIDEASVFGGAIDLGAIWRQTEEMTPRQPATASGISTPVEGKSLVRDKGWRMGLVAQNLGMTSDELMPINFRAGVGYVMQDLLSSAGRGTVALDALVPIDNDIKVSIGAEYANISPNTEFAARVGYKIGNEIQDLDSLAGLTAGAGFAIIAGLIKYQVDYAFVPYGDLGTTHRASLTLAFLPSSNIVKAAPGIKKEIIQPAPEVLPKTLLKSAEIKKPEPKPEPEPEPVKEVSTAMAVAAAPEVEASTAAQPVEKVDETEAALKKLERDLRMFLKRVNAGLLSPVRFDKGKSQLISKTKKSLDTLGKIIEKNKTGNIVVVGYAGSNTVLAAERAKTVARYIKMTFRIDPERFLIKSGDPAQKPKRSWISFEVKEKAQSTK